MSITRRALLGFSAAIVPIHHRVTQEPLRREGSGAGGTMYLGTYGNGIGIATYDAEGRITKTGTIDVPDPSFVIRTGNFLYAVNEQETGAVTAIDISATPRVLNRQPTKGSGPCHLTKIGDHLLTANYGSGDIAVHPINPDGSLGQQTDLVPHEGSAPHAHQVVQAGEYVLSVDLGTDTIYTYTLATGKLTLQHRMNLAPGTGPRHLVLHPSGQYAYVADELNSTVTVCGYAEGILTPLSTLPTAPAGPQNYPGALTQTGDFGTPTPVCVNV